jgi:serine/threonine-protein kinase/endoribonuclease IRE1
MWVQDYQSPVVAIYQLDTEFGGLRKVSFATMAVETLQHVSGQLTSEEWRLRFRDHSNNIRTFV